MRNSAIAEIFPRFRDRWADTIQLVRWTLASCYSISPRLTVALSVVSFLSGLTPVALLIGIRGLIDAQVRLSTAGELSIGGLAPWLSLVCAVAVVEAVIIITRKLLRSRMLSRADLELTTQVLSQAGGLPPAYFDLHDNQEELDDLQGNVGHRVVDTIQRLMGMLVSCLQVFTLSIVLIVIEPVVLLVVVPLFLPYFRFQHRLGKWRYEQEEKQKQSRRWVKYYVQLLTQRDLAAEVRMLGIGPHIIDRFRSHLTQLIREGRATDNKDFVSALFFALLALTGLLLVLGKVVHGSIEGDHSLGDVVVFAACMIRLRKSVEALGLATLWWSERQGKLSALRSFLLQTQETDLATLIEKVELDPKIQLEQVSFSYPGTNQVVLRNISMLIEPGETVAIVGENGSGKSTLVKLIAGMYPDYQGQIKLGGHELREIPREQVRRNICFVFQQFGCYSATVQENIAYGNIEKFSDDLQATEEIANRCGLSDAIEVMPDGMQTMLGREFGDYEPSLGTWQKIAIARAFANEAPLLIMDEPTASIDLRAEHELFQKMVNLASGRTTVLITHRFATVAMADRIFVMHGGELEEQGTHSELLARGGRYSELYSFYSYGMRQDAARDIL